MRQFIRHKSDIPIDFKLYDEESSCQEVLKNYSEGGLCFFSKVWVEPDSEILVTLPVPEQGLEVLASVVWCKYVDGNYEVGIRFLEAQAEQAVRILEQIDRIERYKQELSTQEGRSMNGEEAAREWNRKHR